MRKNEEQKVSKFSADENIATTENPQELKSPQQNYPTVAQNKLKGEIADVQSQLAGLYSRKQSGMMTFEQNQQFQNLEKTKVALEKKMKLRMQMAEASKR